MGKDSKIEWTHHTFNPWWGCVKVSPGCANCYAEGFSKRTGHAVWGAAAPRRFFGEAHWNEPLKWNEEAKKARERRRVFCASMADVFEDRVDLIEPRARLYGLIRTTTELDWLLLTKRPENIYPLTAKWLFPHNVWMGTSAENQEYWDKRVPILLSIPVAIHFVSAEPLLGPIEMTGPLPEWMIVGGESGPRQIQEEWVDSIQRQCVSKRVPFFFKQWGGKTPGAKTAAGRTLNGKTYSEFPEAA